MRDRRNTQFSNLLAKSTLDELWDGNLNTREAFVYTRTCGLDLHWYAGRIRMVGGSGLGLFCVACYQIYQTGFYSSLPLILRTPSPGGVGDVAG